MTSAYADLDTAVAPEGVYLPQEDSQLLVDVMEKTGLAVGNRVADLCTGSGVVAIAASHYNAREVTAFDNCSRAVSCARKNALASGASVEVHLGSWARAVEFGPYDLVVCNPPYVPHDPAMGGAALPSHIGPAHAGTRGTTAVLSSTRCARQHPACSPTAARCCWCNPNSPNRARRLRHWPAPASTPKSLPTSRFHSVPCCHHAPNGWRTPVGSSRAAGKKS